MQTTAINEKVFLIAGEPATGKTAAIKNLTGNVCYICTESKALPFSLAKHPNIKVYPAETATQLITYLNGLALPEKASQFDIVVIDSFTAIMQKFRLDNIDTNKDKRKGFELWAEYGTVASTILLRALPLVKIPVIIIAHNEVTYDQIDPEKIATVQCSIDGGLKKTGIERFFTNILYAQKLDLNDSSLNIADVTSEPMFKITPKEERIGIKYVLKTYPTCPAERIRSPIDMFAENELYIDSDYQKLLDRLNTYYGEELDD